MRLECKSLILVFVRDTIELAKDPAQVPPSMSVPSWAWTSEDVRHKEPVSRTTNISEMMFLVSSVAQVVSRKSSPAMSVVYVDA